MSQKRCKVFEVAGLFAVVAAVVFTPGRVEAKRSPKPREVFCWKHDFGGDWMAIPYRPISHVKVFAKFPQSTKCSWIVEATEDVATTLRPKPKKGQAARASHVGSLRYLEHQWQETITESWDNQWNISAGVEFGAVVKGTVETGYARNWGGSVANTHTQVIKQEVVKADVEQLGYKRRLWRVRGVVDQKTTTHLLVTVNRKCYNCGQYIPVCSLKKICTRIHDKDRYAPVDYEDSEEIKICDPWPKHELEFDCNKAH